MRNGETARLAALALGGFALALVSGCSGVTYGTGTSTEMQTIQDITGMLSLTGEKKPEVDTRPRAGIVTPPSTETLPPPVDETTTASIDWPNDPDEQLKRLRQEQEDGPLPQGQLPTMDPGFRLPKGATQNREPAEESWDYSRGPNPALVNAKAREEYAKMRSERGGSVDAAGNPVRRYLTEPPADYRVPDPSAPVDPEPPPEQKKKFSLRDLWPF